MKMHAGISNVEETALKITGMTCTSCARTIERVLSRVPGVKSAKVDFGLSIAMVAGAADTARLVEAVEVAGFGASPWIRSSSEGNDS